MIVNKPDKKKKSSRYVVFYIIMFVMFGTILGKLLYLQVYKHADYQEKADIGSTRFISEKAPRGNIYDSSGNVLATNNQTYVLTYMQTDEATKAFYPTMKKIFTILKENNEKFQDDLLLKINSNGEFYYDFKTQNTETQKSIEIRFKKDRGLNEEIEIKLFEDKKGDYTDEDIEMINSALLEVSPLDTFYYMVSLYDLYEILLPEEYTKEESDALRSEFKIPKSDSKEKVDDLARIIERGKKITDRLLQEYTLEEIRNYVVVKDSIKMQSFKGYRAVTIANNIKKDTAFIFYQRLNDLPGVDVSLEPVRYYPFRELASHVLGYVSSIDSSQEEKYELRGYDASSDLIGVDGIEAAFEDQLKGNKGGTTVKVNSQGRKTEELFRLEVNPGNNIHLTIDKGVQYAAEQGLKDTLERMQGESPNATRGAVVAIEVETGRVIAMASYPNYDPNDFAIPGELSEEKFEQYFNPDIEKFGKEHIARTGATMTLDELFRIDEKTGNREDNYDIYPRAMFNYATLGRIPPGSVLKPFTSVAGLLDGVITTTEVMNDATGRWINKDLGIDKENFGGTANGPTDLRYALQKSSNYYYYETGYRMYMKNGANIEALDTLAKYAWKFGLGVDPDSPQAGNPSTGIQIEENFGQIYNFKSWKNQLLNFHMFNLVDYMKAGNINGYTFIPLDIESNANDSDELKKAKENLKNAINGKLETVGTDTYSGDVDKFATELEPYVENVMNYSESYKENIKQYESEKNTKVDLEQQSAKIATALAIYTISDVAVQMITPGQIIDAAIGQGMDVLTPLQIANYVATLANGGTRYKVSLVDKITDPNGNVVQEFKPEVMEEINIPAEYLQAIKDGMRAVNTSPANGTAYQSFNSFPIAVAGKTGTADFASDDAVYRAQGRNPYGNYISFAPIDNPKIAIFSTLYDGLRGSEGATVHKAIYEAYFAEELLKMDSSYASKSSTFNKYVTNAPKDNSAEAIAEEKKKQEEAAAQQQNNTQQQTNTP